MIIALNEVYFGKTKRLIEAEKILTDLKKQYDGEMYDVYKIQLDSN